MKTTLPPLSKEAQKIDGWIWIYAGSRAWELVGRGPECRAVIFPYNRSAYEYRWPVDEARVIVIGHDRPEGELADLADALLVDGALEVWVQSNAWADLQRCLPRPSDARRRA